MNEQKVISLVKQLLAEIGEDPQREGLKNTPIRVVRMYKDLTAGYQISTKKLINGAIFEGASNMIVLKDIEFYSLCEHHLLPFFGKCHIGYIPEGKVLSEEAVQLAERFVTLGQPE